ncbi:FtsH protease activity modulator HflK [Ferrovibrio sp.]|uniref:FtsH protease activity modulator HflK n=1 Tax=Ferrovibrio sp. TaxID=1917215 RepID=UPI000CC0F7F1|nr:FtsH protease activity modulator HflK [Ferrovibrio sp.]PJI42322.1 MAG: FtsH protease activity modulator HflK [Ferrovibrio sp.]
MPWSNQGGGFGGGGGGGRGPWGQGSGGGNRGSGGGNGGGPFGGGPNPPSLEEILRKGQDRFRGMLPGGDVSGRGILLLILVAVAIWLGTGVYRVDTDEQGVVLRFGKVHAVTEPGLRYRLPWPVDSVLTPKVTTVNREEIGFRSLGESSTRGAQQRDVPEESLMLTGDENIVDIDFTVLWQVKDAGQYLFNVVDPARTIKQVAESAIREVVGKNNIQFILTEGRTKIADDTRRVMQAVLDGYNAGIVVTQVALQRTEPPASVIDAFRDVQAAQADRERAQNEAEAYRNDIIPRARGEVQRLLQQAEAYKQETIANAQGDASRFTQVYNEYRQAKDVTTKRMYLETMEQIMRGTNKVIVDSQGGANGVVPYLPLPELQKQRQPAQPQPQR